MVSGTPGVMVVGIGGTNGKEVIVKGPPTEAGFSNMVIHPSEASGHKASPVVLWSRMISQHEPLIHITPAVSEQPKLFVTTTEIWWLPVLGAG